jgi:hypothetical protein
MSYTPRAGSIAASVIEHLLGKPKGTALTAAELCGFLNQPTSIGLGSFLAHPVKHGILSVERRDGDGVLVYSLGKPRDPVDADEERGGKPEQRIVKAKSMAMTAAPGPTSVFDQGAGTPPPSGFKGWLKRQAEEPAPAPRTKPPARHVRTNDGAVRRIPQAIVPRVEQTSLPPDICCAMFNTGDLLIEAPGQQPLRLNARQCADLVGYLQRFHSAAV